LTSRPPSGDLACPPDAVFVDLVDGRLAVPDTEALHRHAERCESCRAALVGLGVGEARTGAGIARALLGAGEGGHVGRTVDRKYRLLRYLGAGGMGTVYEAAHRETGRRVAVKLLHGHPLLHGPGALTRFRREARAIGAVDSPHVVTVLDAGEDEKTGDRYLVMELLHGEDLQSLLDREGPLPPEVALRLAGQALVGLERAHAAGIVHRDIKPANLFLVRGEGGTVTVKLLDFGIAKVAADAPFAVSASGAGLAGTAGLLGSPLYMSPEQVQSSGDVDARTDLWSLGSVLYYALAGRPPFAGITTVGRLLLAICGSAAPPLEQIAPWVPAEVTAVVARALTIDRELRHPSAAAMLEALQGLSPGGIALRLEMLKGVTAEEQAVVAAVRPGTGTWRRRPVLVAGSVVLGVALAAATWRTLSTSGLPRTPIPGAAPSALLDAERAPPAASPPAASASNEPALPPHAAPSAKLRVPDRTRTSPRGPAPAPRASAEAAPHRPGVVVDPPF